MRKRRFQSYITSSSTFQDKRQASQAFSKSHNCERSVISRPLVSIRVGFCLRTRPKSADNLTITFKVNQKSHLRFDRLLSPFARRSVNREVTFQRSVLRAIVAPRGPSVSGILRSYWPIQQDGGTRTAIIQNQADRKLTRVSTFFAPQIYLFFIIYIYDRLSLTTNHHSYAKPHPTCPTTTPSSPNRRKSQQIVALVCIAADHVIATTVPLRVRVNMALLKVNMALLLRVNITLLSNKYGFASREYMNSILMRRADGLSARTSSHAASTTEEGPRMPGFLVRELELSER